MRLPRYIQIDDCWAASKRSPAGAIVPDPARFPSGMKALADYLHGKGMHLGLYGDIGDSTCGGFIGFNISAVADPVQDAKLAADAETMIGWGMDSLKVDGCARNNTAAALASLPNRSLGRSGVGSTRSVIWGARRWQRVD